ncbi:MULTISPECIES: MlrC C-terminal domain-containing protein [Enterococcus]|uniref:MlrC C-terminal domain-containing protein n=1 Tax=Enterococcus TaxID=1350 RepID=UPI001D09866E|nr:MULTISPECIES: MlrC C-terminal domain-containing protein [Enterococcus]MCB7450229.1 MlrC C-terminal domain-containing protein [Enterococcus gallinarum]
MKLFSFELSHLHSSKLSFSIILPQNELIGNFATEPQRESVSYTELDQFRISGVELSDYEVIVVKQGYISPAFDGYGEYCVMALTDGPTQQATEKLDFKQIKRPMFPYDKLNLPYTGRIEGGFE